MLRSAPIGLLFRLASDLCSSGNGFGLFDGLRQLAVRRQLLVVLHPVGRAFDLFHFHGRLLIAEQSLPVFGPCAFSVEFGCALLARMLVFLAPETLGVVHWRGIRLPA